MSIEMTIKGNQAVRISILLRMYEITEGNTREPVYIENLQHVLNLTDKEIKNAIQYLKDSGMILEPTSDGYVVFQISGVDWVENGMFNESEISLDNLEGHFEELKQKFEHLSLGQEVIFNEMLDLAKNDRIPKSRYLTYLYNKLIDKGVDHIFSVNFIENL